MYKLEKKRDSILSGAGTEFTCFTGTKSANTDAGRGGVAGSWDDDLEEPYALDRGTLSPLVA